MECLLIYGIYYFFGVSGMVFFLIYAAGTIFLVETINYVEHYGLKRNEMTPGVYEPVSIHHSWNAPQTLQNILLLKLQRHSDHHARALKPYQTLCSYEESPTLPAGYPICVLISMFPPIWFKVINPLCPQVNVNGKVDEKVFVQSRKTLNQFIFGQVVVLSTLMLFS